MLDSSNNEANDDAELRGGRPAGQGPHVTPRRGKDKELFAREFSFLRRQWVRKEIMRIFYRVTYHVKQYILLTQIWDVQVNKCNLVTFRGMRTKH